MLDPTQVSRKQLQMQLKARMLKSIVVNEGAQTGLYTRGVACGWKGCRREFPTSVHWLRSQLGAGAAGADW
jgi:hypothetical protein